MLVLYQKPRCLHSVKKRNVKIIQKEDNKKRLNIDKLKYLLTL
jgi:hypothetical protein